MSEVPLGAQCFVGNEGQLLAAGLTAAEIEVGKRTEGGFIKKMNTEQGEVYYYYSKPVSVSIPDIESTRKR